MHELPEPLLSSSVKTGNMSSMLLDFNRLINSDFFALSTGDEFKAAVALWAAAWAQTPAGSLPADERILSALSRSKSWKKVKDAALHGFILCSDNRLYHPVLCEKALEVFEKREKFLEKNEKNLKRQKKWRDSAKAEKSEKRNKANLQVDDSEEDLPGSGDDVTRYDDVTERVTLALHNAHKEKVKVKSKEKEKALNQDQDQEQEQEQELRALRARAEEQKNNTKKVNADDQSAQQSESALAASQQAASGDASLAKKAVSKREKSNKTASSGIDLSNLPPNIDVKAAETLIAHRKAKRSPFVQVTFDRFIAKVLEASTEIGISPDAVIFEVVDAGWTGFRTDWLKTRLSTTQKTGGFRPRFSAMSAAEKLAARSHEYADFFTDAMTSEIAGAVTIDATAVSASAVSGRLR